MDKKNIEAIYTLSPMQQAFLWHSLQHPDAGLLHVRCRLRGDLDPALLKQAWERTLSRHPALRTSVHWQNVKEPLQVVSRQVVLPWQQYDWRNDDGRENIQGQQALSDFLQQDCDRGFDLTQAPILRISLIQRTDRDYELIWSCHHLMLDGWSSALVLNEVLDRYAALYQKQPRTFRLVRPYQDYIRWLKQQETDPAAVFWRNSLKGCKTIASLPAPHPLSPRAAASPARHNFSLSPDLTTALQSFLRQHQLTLNTLVQGAWALLLHSYSRETDVLFGTVVSGRQADLAGVEAMVGLLINVIPVRVQLSPQQALLSWLQSFQKQQAAAIPHAYASLAQIQTWSELTGRLFDSLLAIENYPWPDLGNGDIASPWGKRSLQVDNLQSGVVSTYGLTMVVKPGSALEFVLHSDPRRFDRATMQQLMAHLQFIVTEIIQNPHRSIAAVLPAIASPLSTASAPRQPDLNRATLAGSWFAPRNQLEFQLACIWESVLDVRPLSVKDNFFDLGGDSLIAVQLFNQMQQQLGCDLPLATLFQAPTIRQFAALLSPDRDLPQWSSLVPIQTSGSQRPFFFHGGSADALTWARFSNLLGPDQPFYALQRPDLDGGEMNQIAVEDLAATCLREIRRVQPVGPYLLGGHCFGGTVAFEIAQQLQAQGEAIAGLMLVDAYLPESLPETIWVQLQTKLYLGLFWLRKNYYYHGDWKQLAQLPKKLKKAMGARSQKLQFLKQANREIASNGSKAQSNIESVASQQTSLPYEYRYARAQRANEIAAERYSPKMFSGNIKLFKSTIQNLQWYFGPALGWQAVTKGTVDPIKIPGFFGNLFNHRSGPLLAQSIKAHLKDLQT